ncbi:MAG TPA: DUF4394 domain-containing protein, partial [Planctomycetota bacterium]|nr:DUF4394 domain-containing protein [Planctomycetota bacterium]
DPGTGVATFVGGPITPTPTIAATFGLDFNPVPDRIRFVSDLEQNLRLNPDTGALAATDTNADYVTGDVNDVANPNIVDVAYTNNVAGATSTVLYAIDSTQNVLARFADPNAGTMNTVGTFTTITTAVDTGFDIAPNGTAYLSLNNGSLFTVNLTNAQTTQIGTIAGGTVRTIAAITNSAQQTLAFTAATSTTIEGNSTEIQVTRTGGSSGVVSVDYAFSAGTATAGTDFPLATGTLTFLAGETTRTIIVPIPTDTTLELFETVTVTLSNAVGAVVGTQSTHTLSIADKDDVDGDGFTNQVETNAGSDPNSAGSTPFGSAAAGTAQPLTVDKLAIKLSYTKPASDSISFAGSLALPSGFTAAGQKVVINIDSVNGVVKTLTLDAKGKTTPKGNDSFSIAAPKGGTAKFAVKLQKGDFFDALQSLGFTKDVSIKDLDAKLQIDIFIANTNFRATLDVLISTSKGKGGSAKLKKK